MKVVNLKEFLKLDEPILYIKCDEYGNAEGELSVSYGESSEGSIDFITVGLHSFIKKCNGNSSCDEFAENDILKNAIKNNEHFEWDYTMIGRDGLYNENQLFMVYEKLDLLKLIKELNKIYDMKYHKDEYELKYDIY